MQFTIYLLSGDKAGERGASPVKRNEARDRQRAVMVEDKSMSRQGEINSESRESMGCSPRENSSRGHGVYIRKEEYYVEKGQSLVGRELQQSNRLRSAAANFRYAQLLSLRTPFDRE